MTTPTAAESYWQRIQTLHHDGKLAPEFERAYFTNPRPVYELYDLEKDPGELNNLAGQSEYKQIERELKVALQEKMILDYDFLPLPIADKGQAPNAGKKSKKK